MLYPTNRFFVGYWADPYPTKSRILHLTTGLVVVVEVEVEVAEKSMLSLPIGARVEDST